MVNWFDAFAEYFHFAGKAEHVQTLNAAAAETRQYFAGNRKESLALQTLLEHSIPALMFNFFETSKVQLLVDISIPYVTLGIDVRPLDSCTAKKLAARVVMMTIKSSGAFSVFSLPLASLDKSVNPRGLCECLTPVILRYCKIPLYVQASHESCAVLRELMECSIRAYLGESLRDYFAEAIMLMLNYLRFEYNMGTIHRYAHQMTELHIPAMCRQTGPSAIDLSLFTSLRTCVISGNCLSSLPPSLATTPLVGLDISSNMFRSVPPAVYEIATLEVLNVSNNKLESLGTFEVMTSLKCIDLSYNTLSLLPSSVFCLNNLEKVRVCHNKLGTLPASISSCSALKFLHVDFNQLEEIPDQVSDCKLLVEISAKHNLIKWVSPLLASLPNLQVLALQGNFVDIAALSKVMKGNQQVQRSLKKMHTHKRKCSLCGRTCPSKLKCKNCSTIYCSKECQKKDWKDHKACCNHKAPTIASTALEDQIRSLFANE